MADRTDVLLVTALEIEFAAARDVATQSIKHQYGVEEWEPCEEGGSTPYLRGTYRTLDGRVLHIALARPTRMGSTATLAIAAPLADRLKPRCLAMSGVCAGNPSELALGDVIVAEMAYAYDEGKLKSEGFEGDFRQYPLRDTWVRFAQSLRNADFPSFRVAQPDDAKNWLLERLYVGDNPQKHPARLRYFPNGEWGKSIKRFIDDGLIIRNGARLELTQNGQSVIEELRILEVEAPLRLPFEIKVGPIATGNVVVKDGLTWEKLAKWGVRSVLGLEMEAAAIASLAHRLEIPDWVVVKGVMDHADPRKEDRHKPFAARVAAEVLYKLLSVSLGEHSGEPATMRATATVLSKTKSGPSYRPDTGTYRNALFETYQPEYEPYYLERDLDRDVGEALQQSGLWLYGRSGTGKTCAITRYFRRNNDARCVCISLASCLDGKIRTILEHIQIELWQYARIEAFNLRGLTDSQIIGQIKQTLANFCTKIKYLYIDEIPIDNTKVYRQFIQALGAILHPSDIFLAVSSILSPRDFIPLKQRSLLGNVRIIELKPWESNELRKLVYIIEGALNISIENEPRERILEAAMGSPRFVKKVLGTLLAHEKNPAWPLERIIEETQLDLG